MTHSAEAARKPPPPLSEIDDRELASFAHFGNIVLLLPALIIRLALGSRGPKTRVESTEALNWTINLTALLVVEEIVMVVLVLTLPYDADYGIVVVFTAIFWITVIVNVVFAVIGGVTVRRKGAWRYPVNLRWVK